MSLLKSGRSVWRNRSVLKYYRPASFLRTSFRCQPRLASYSTVPEQATQRKLLLFSIGGAACFATGLYYCCSCYSRAYCSRASTQEQRESSHSFPTITLYEFPACPFCSKVKTFLSYYDIPHNVVSVNPLTRKEVKFSDNKKLPFIVVDGEQIHDSTLIISVLRTCMIRSQSVSESLHQYPELSMTDASGKTTTEFANKYFIMYGEEPSTSSVGERREEREWRQWVDDHLVHTLPSNIYRSLSESRQAMAVIAEKSTLSSFQRFLARNIGSVGLYFIGKRNAKKYKLKADVRESLYDCCNKWVKAVGKDRRFMGGSQPNLADLAVFGAISATEGLATLMDLHTHTKIGTWYQDMRELVYHSTGP